MEFSAFKYYDQSVDVIKHLLLQLPPSAVFYVRDVDQANEILHYLNSFNIKAKMYKDTKEESKNDVLKEFNSNKLNYIVSKESLAIERLDLRAVIFYGMPKYIEKLYKESLKAGADGKPAKCIVIWSTQDMDVYQNLLEENCAMVQDGKSSLFVDYCNSLLIKMKEYCEETKCRRWVIRKYFNENYPPPKNFHDTCCDNCQKIIKQRAPLNIMYEELAEDGSLDISEDLRRLLGIFNRHKEGFIEMDFINILQGKKLTKPYPLEYFGTGYSKLDGYWKYIFNLAIDKNYLRILPPHQITQFGLKFLRVKKKIIEIFPTPELCKSLTKKNVLISIENESIIVKAKNEILKQEIDKNSEELDDISLEPIFRPKENSLPNNESDNFFEFSMVRLNPIIKKRKIQENENIVEEKPKSDWREALAAALARKDNNKFHDSTSIPTESKLKAPNDNKNTPGCSHWSFPQASISTITEEFNDSQSQEENKQDEEQEIIAYVATMTSVRNKIKKPLKMPLIDLLEYIEKVNEQEMN